MEPGNRSGLSPVPPWVLFSLDNGPSLPPWRPPIREPLAPKLLAQGSTWADTHRAGPAEPWVLGWRQGWMEPEGGATSRREMGVVVFSLMLCTVAQDLEQGRWEEVEEGVNNKREINYDSKAKHFNKTFTYTIYIQD